MLLKPKIFISYSREQFHLATIFKKELENKGYSVFIDTQGIKVGDPFPQKIEEALRKCNAVILLISNASISSEWCKYEYYHAYFHKRIIIPVITEQIETGKESPLNYFQKEVNYVSLENESEAEVKKLLEKIKDKLTDTVRRAIISVSRRILLLVTIVLLILLVFRFGVQKINNYNYSVDKEKLIQNARNSKLVLTNEEIHTATEKFKSDAELAGQLYTIENDTKESVVARTNARILIGAVLNNSSLNMQMQVDSIEWKNSGIKNNQLSNRFFRAGRMKLVNIEKTILSNITFAGRTEKTPNGFALDDVNFNSCSFYGVFFLSNIASSDTFSACKFYGCSFNVSNFLSVYFMTLPETDPSVIDASKSTYFENCIFENNFEPEKSGVIDFVQSKSIKFKDINFSNCQFRNVVNPEWFENCGFYNCTFPSAEVVITLKKGNHVE